jgi:hypothetical protein
MSIIKYRDPYGEEEGERFDIGEIVDVDGFTHKDKNIKHIVIIDTWDYDGDFDDELMKPVYVEAGAWIAIVHKDSRVEPEIDCVYIRDLYKEGTTYDWSKHNG